MNGPLVVPEPLDEDDDDIRWALHTAAVQWGRGAREDAIAWVRRGAEAAVDGGFWERASQLNAAASQLERSLKVAMSGIPPQPPSFPKPLQVSASVTASLAPPSSQLPRTPSFSVPATARTSRPAPVRVSAGESASATTPSSRWPSDFPKTAATGRSLGPPPLPTQSRGQKAPIPPPPTRPKTSDFEHDAVEIEISEEAVDLSEEEALALGADAPSAPRAMQSVGISIPPLSSPITSSRYSPPPTYTLGEDPSDGTTSLSGDGEPGTSHAPDSLRDVGLPAFPLSDSVPSVHPQSLPSLSPGKLRQRPPPHFASVRPTLTGPPRAASLPAPPVAASLSSRAPGLASREEPTVRPLSSTARVQAQVTVPAAPASAALRGVFEEPTLKTTRSAAAAAAALGEQDETQLQPIAHLAGDPAGFDPHDEFRELSPSEVDADELTSDEIGEPPPTARGLGQLGTVPPPSQVGRPSTSPSVPACSPSSTPLTARSAASAMGETVDADAAPAVSSEVFAPVRGSAAPIRRPSARIEVVLPSEPPAEGLEDTAPAAPPSIRGIPFNSVRGLCDLPEDAQRALRQRARIERMGTDEDLSFFAVVLVLEGWVKLMPAIADVTCATAAAGDVVFTQGTLNDGVALRVVAGQNGTTLAAWDKATFAEITQPCPWVEDELRLVADSFQALAGATLGALGERLDDALRSVVTSKCTVLSLMPGEALVQRGKPVPGMHIVGGGTVELLDETGATVQVCAPGEFLFTQQVLAAGPAPLTARAGSSGALILFARRMDAHELLVSVPPLLEILAG